MMYLAFAPRSKADVGTIVELSEKIVSITINDARNFALERLSIGAPWVGNRDLTMHILSQVCVELNDIWLLLSRALMSSHD
jgi:hypothetical protein